MEIPLIPDLSNPKWLIVQEMLKSISSAHAKKIASRLKIPDVKIFLDCIKILISVIPLNLIIHKLFLKYRPIRNLKASWS
ncbi:MAG: hypothetical protein FIB08_00255 [Candidatus Methanoperedens sp.]|nr:hypothetical protein [Candidatus Methanoperedens sp.]